MEIGLVRTGTHQNTRLTAASSALLSTCSKAWLPSRRSNTRTSHFFSRSCGEEGGGGRRRERRNELEVVSGEAGGQPDLLDDPCRSPGPLAARA